LIAALMAWLTWRGSFVALGVVSLVWGVIWALYFRNEPKDHPAITRRGLRRCRRALPIRGLKSHLKSLGDRWCAGCGR